MTLEDIHSTLLQLNMISVLDSNQPTKPLPGQTIKFPKGRKNGIARKHLQRTQTHDDDKVRGPFVPPTRYKVRWDADDVADYLARWEAKGYLKLSPEKLKWSPFILSRAKKTQSSEGDAAFGTEAGDARGASTEAQLSEANGSVLDGAADIQSLVEKTRSPAFALFDDDNVEVVRASTSRDARSSDHTDADGSRARSTSVDPIDKTRAKRNRTASGDGPSAIRRLRSRDPVNESTPLRRRPHTPRQDALAQSDRRKYPVRSRFAQAGNDPSTPSLDDDAALAARLAMELDSPRRQLRSRRPSNDSMSVQKRSNAASRSVSPKKRRRVDSSPEVEKTPPRSPVTRRSSRMGEKNVPVYPKSTPATPSRRSARRANGRTPIKPTMALREEEEEEEEEEEDPQQRLPAFDGFASGDAGTATDMEDGKYEDADTPATGATAASRHSVPSDDTMIGADPARSKMSPISRLDPLSVLAQVAGEIADANAAMDVREAEAEDEDAEGEEDLDAEGEPDEDGAP